MEIIKCKACGGELEILEGSNIFVCGFCGTKHTLPRHDEERGNLDSILKRAFIFLEDGNWGSADEYCERALDINPENAKAYVGKLMVDLQIKKEPGLANSRRLYTENHNYLKALRFADKGYKAVLQGYNDTAIRRLEERRRETNYVDAKSLAQKMEIASMEKAIALFESIADYKDSAEQLSNCKRKLAELTALEEQNRLELGKKRIEQEEQKRLEEKKTIRKVIVTTVPVAAAIIVFSIIFNTIIIPESKYTSAIHFMDAGRYDLAFSNFETLGDYQDSAEKSKEAYLGIHADTVRCLNLTEFEQVRAWILANRTTVISASDNSVIALQSNGHAVAVGYYLSGQCEVSNWSNIVAVSAGSSHTVGLEPDGSVRAKGEDNFGSTSVWGWSDIVAISAGQSYTVGLKQDGSVVTTDNHSISKVSDWVDIVAVSAGKKHVVGLKADGSVVAVGGKNYYDERNVGNWAGIIAVAAGDEHTVGLKHDGSMVAVGNNEEGQCNVTGWADIIAVSAGAEHTVGLKAGGTAVAVGENGNGCCDVGEWSDIVAISAGNGYTIALKSDGTLVYTGVPGFTKYYDKNRTALLNMSNIRTY